MPTSRSLTPAAVALVVAVVLAVNGPLLPALWTVVGLDDIFYSFDSATHFVRMMHARDYYFPSGHHWGWDPFWFQGYVPFQLYPHLTYSLLALAAQLPVEPHRIFNAYAVGLYLGLPITAGLLVCSARGLLAAALVAAWIAAASSTYGVGTRGVFYTGLLTQQAGLLLFAAAAYDLVVSRRLERASVWMGVAALTHVHTALLGALAWGVEGLLRAVRRDAAEPLGPWLRGSVIATLIAAPTVVGILSGWDQIGPSTSFPHPANTMRQLLRGDLLAPAPMLAAVCVGAVGAALTAASGARARAWTMLALGALLAIVALVDVRFEGFVGRTVYFMLRLRSMPFALLWLALLAAWGWPRAPRTLRIAMIALTLAGLPGAWQHMNRSVERIANPAPSHRAHEMERLAALGPALRWVVNDVGEETATLVLGRRANLDRGLSLKTALEIARLPMLGGHGIELSSVHNSRLVYKPERLGCAAMREKISRYAVGYIIVGDLTRRLAFERCLETEPAFENDPWWVFATGERWDRLASGVRAFEHDPTWTELAWTIGPPQPAEFRLTLPMAATAPWEAEIDGVPAEILRTKDALMAIDVPPNAERVRMRYLGPPGEWVSLAASVGGLALGIVTILRARRRRHGTGGDPST